MKKLLYIFKYICFGIQLLLLFAEGAKIIIESRHSNGLLDCFFILIVVVLIFIDLYKFIDRNEKNKKNKTTWLMGIQILLCTIILFYVGDSFIQMYYFFLLDYIFNEESGKRKWLVSIHFVAIISAEMLRMLTSGNRRISECIESIAYLSIIYGIVLFVFLIIHYFKDEQFRLQRLNTDMIAYSFEERKYLIEKERSDISQELHDTIGHSLMAVLLNVRYLKAIADKPQEEKNIQINEIEKLLTECVASLRSSVTNLRELEENINLKEEIDRVIHKFDHLGYIKIKLDYDDTVDKASKNSKAAIYKTIQEGITNSIRHGNASKIYIIINMSYQKIQLIIQDNGLGCTYIHKSYGLKGIEERFQKLSGEVTFTSTKNKGFTIQAVFPERKEK